MDSLTHIVLGAAIGDSLLGKKIGRKAAWIGALAKTFPDFDLFISGLNDPRKYILYHRSYTHSFFVELLTAFPLAWIFFLLFKKQISYSEWFILCLTCLWGHSLVDMFTNYGTRLFLPFSQQLVSLNNIAIADAFLTLPIFIMVVVALFYRNRSAGRTRWMYASLIFATLYFSLTFINKAVADRHIKQSARNRGILTEQYMSNPTILNNILWYSLINQDSTLWVGEYSLLQRSDSVHWRPYAINKALLQNNPSADARMLEWFSQGFLIVQQDADTLNVFIPKFGRGDLDKTVANETFLFYYQIYFAGGKWQFSAHQPDKEKMNFAEAFSQLVRHVRAEGK